MREHGLNPDDKADRLTAKNHYFYSSGAARGVANSLGLIPIIVDAPMKAAGAGKYAIKGLVDLFHDVFATVAESEINDE